ETYRGSDSVPGFFPAKPRPLVVFVLVEVPLLVVGIVFRVRARPGGPHQFHTGHVGHEPHRADEGGDSGRLVLPAGLVGTGALRRGPGQPAGVGDLQDEFHLESHVAGPGVPAGDVAGAHTAHRGHTTERRGAASPRARGANKARRKHIRQDAWTHA